MSRDNANFVNAQEAFVNATSYRQAPSVGLCSTSRTPAGLSISRTEPHEREKGSRARVHW